MIPITITNRTPNPEIIHAPNQRKTALLPTHLATIRLYPRICQRPYNVLKYLALCAKYFNTTILFCVELIRLITVDTG